MYKLSNEQRDFLNTLITFRNVEWFLDTSESETILAERCIKEGEYSSEDKILLNGIVKYFKDTYSHKLTNGSDIYHFKKYI